MNTATLFDELPVELQAPGRGVMPVDAIVDAVVPAAARTITVLALDLSLTATGAAGNARGGWAATIKPPAKLKGHARLAYILDEIRDCYLPGVDYVAVEGPAWGAKGSAYHQLAGEWWLVTHMLWQLGLPVAVVGPTTRAKYATGKGGAGKDLVMVEVARRFTWFNGDNNAADATFIAAMVCDHLGIPMATMPALNRTALDAVEWPELAGGAAC